MRKGFVLFVRLSIFLFFILLLVPIQSAGAAPNLTVIPITWNVIGLDSNNVNVGPNNFPVGVRVCNMGDEPATNVQADFVWDSANALINLRPGSFDPITIPVLNDGDCYDFYFEVEITRDSAAYFTTRRYHIDVTADGGISVSTPTPREVYVERLVSQNRNSTLDVKLDGVSIAPGGTMALVVGETYTITLVAKTATNGYEQIESFINFPNTIFQVNSVKTTYSANSSATVDNPSDLLYGDACIWQNDPNSPQYRSCLSTGKAGGNIEVEYTVTIIGGAGTSNILNTLVYDFSGASYHYNSDYSVGGRIAVIVDPTLVTISKNFNPDPTNAGGTSILTFTLTNPNGAPVSDVSFTDNLPNTPGVMAVAVAPNASTSGCGAATFAPTAGATTLNFSNGTIAANGTCVISVNVTVPTAGTYNNTTTNLFVGTVDTGKTASDSLTVNATPPAPACIAGLPIASWDFSNTTNAQSPPPSSPPSSTDSATAGAGTGLTRFFINTQAGNNQVGTTGSWEVDNVSTAAALNTANNEYFEFSINTTGFESVTLTFWAFRTTQGANNIQLYYGPTGGTASSVYAITTSWQQFTVTLNSGLNANGATLFRLYAYNAGVTNNGHSLYIDGVTFTGCGLPKYPELTKSFSPDPVAVGGASTLTFTITNPNPTVGLSGLAFTDSLPSGVTVATSGPTSVCGGSLTTIAPSTVTFTGGSLLANASCNIPVQVAVTTAGPHTNISGFISSTQTGTNSTSTGSASDTVTAVLPPTISKLFAPNPILAGSTSTLTFTIENPNIDQPLSGVVFTDTFPAGMVVADPTGASTYGCGAPTYTLAIGAGSISFSGGTMAAGGTCTVTVNVTGPTEGSYSNTTKAVTAIINGSPVGTDTASDTLDVEAPNPAIVLLKQVSTSPAGPWFQFLSVTPGSDVYYQFTVENTGDVPLSPVSLTDTTLNVSACNTTWSSLTLQVADANDDDHIAICVVGPVTAVTGTNTNTASATGTYSGTPYTSTASAATYATPALTLTKSAAETYFTAAGNTLNYTYVVVNTGFVPLLGPVVVTDDKTTVSCPAVSTAVQTAPPSPGDGDNYLDPGESITCTATYTVITGDVTAGFVTNTATASVGGADSNQDSVTVPRQLPDLGVTKTNNANDAGAVGVPFTWTMTVRNTGLLGATFADGQTLLSDPLPAGATYGSPTPGNFTDITGSANISCSIDGGNVLTCTASGSSVTLGAPTGSFTVSFSVTPTAGGSLANTATVDPNNNIPEVDKTNNTGSNTVAIDSVIIDAVDDDYSATPINGFIGGNAGNAFTNDTLNGVAVDPADITATVLTPASDPGVTLNTTTGSVDVAAGTPAGIYTIEYQICEVLNPANCDTATITVEVSSASINAVDDSAGPINGLIGATNVLNVFDNDTLNGLPVNPADVILTLQPGGDPELTLNTDGSVDVAPGTPAGTYAFDYEICEILNPTNCDITTVTVTVEAATIDAMDDDYSATPINGPTGGSVGNAFTNDTLNGVAVNLGEITATVITPASNPGVTLNTTTGSVDVAAGTPAGIYTIEYEICENLNPTNCDMAIITVAVEAASIFDPPSAIKTFNAAGLPELEFRMVWINSGNATAIAVQVTDNIPTGTTYVPGSITCEPRGSSSNAAVVSSPLSAAAVPNSFCGFDAVNNRIQWQGNIGPDDGNFTEDTAANEVVITFRVTVNGGVNQVLNQSFSRTDVDADGDFDEETVLGTSLVGSNRVIWNRSLSGGVDPEPRVILPGSLPTTGFPPSVTTILPEQPASLMYSSTSVWLEIPSLDVRIAIVGVPLVNGDWDVSWLGGQAGWLDGTAFPSWRGNSALTGHVTLSNGQSGPFANLENLKWGDRVVVHAYGFAYIYEVRENKVLVPHDTSVLKHEKDAWLTLVTCKNYNETTDTYTNRVSVRAVLISAQKEQAKNIPTGAR
jgi:LPXTG-site transpeptidase (sortase) family protein